uniref:ANK_REP_REGION domain-containing protein n=2 Tax=Caenorhabditis tropicalis TaxID=1561998 RepID=A0A1I7T458_9PELO
MLSSSFCGPLHFRKNGKKPKGSLEDDDERNGGKMKMKKKKEEVKMIERERRDGRNIEEEEDGFKKLGRMHEGLVLWVLKFGKNELFFKGLEELELEGEEVRMGYDSRIGFLFAVRANRTVQMGTKIEMAARACQIGDIQTVRFLLNGHVSADELDQQGCGLLHWAAINDKVDIIELLLSHNSNIDLIGGNMRSTPLHWACYNSQLSAVVCLVKNGANPTLRNANGETALHVATKNANTTIITYLLVKFKNIVDLRDHSGCSALLCAASSGFGLFPIRTFIQFDAYLDFTDDETGDTALHVTMKRQNLVAAVDLIYARADETKKNKKGQTAFDLVDEKLVKHVKEHVEIRKIREKGTRCEKMKSRGFLMNVFTATITGILLFVGLVLFILTNFWVVVSLLAVSIPLTIFSFERNEWIISDIFLSLISFGWEWLNSDYYYSSQILVFFLVLPIPKKNLSELSKKAKSVISVSLVGFLNPSPIITALNVINVSTDSIITVRGFTNVFIERIFELSCFSV